MTSKQNKLHHNGIITVESQQWRSRRWNALWRAQTTANQLNHVVCLFVSHTRQIILYYASSSLLMRVQMEQICSDHVLNHSSSVKKTMTKSRAFASHFHPNSILLCYNKIKFQSNRT